MKKNNNNHNEKIYILEVQSAKDRDEGRNIIRIDEKIMKNLNLETGDIVVIKGKKKSAGIVWPNYPDDKGLQIARIDSRLRKNTKTKKGDIVRIRKAKAKDAKSVSLTALNFDIKRNSQVKSLIKKNSQNTPITLDDNLIISRGKGRKQKFKVTNLEPKGVCLITPETKLHIIENLPKEVKESVDKNYNIILIKEKLREYLKEDCQFKDVSSAFIPEEERVKAKIIAKSKGYISGLTFFNVLCDMCNVESDLQNRDGDFIEKGDHIVDLTGNAHDILLIERVGLNLLTHMSAISSTTRKYVNLTQKLKKKTKIAGTRKTLPGLRIFEKAAIEIGGGDPHRFSLDDMILLKDTHLRYYNGDVEVLLRAVKEKASFTKKIEIEIEKVENLLTAAKIGADIIMLDNMDPEEVKNAINLLNEHGLRNKVLIEVSGGINFENLASYLEAEPDVISSSRLTQFPSEEVDLSLHFY
ncbi:MAG: carboxylating nicotinate-nucleotide diphosphorylase [Promethearchaeia archaeon]